MIPVHHNPFDQLVPDSPSAMAIEKHLQHMARFDQESGLLNYDAFCSAINVELARAANSQPTSTLIELKLKGLSRSIEVAGRKAGLYIVRQLVERFMALNLEGAIYGRIDHKTFSVFLCRDNDPVTVLQVTKQLIAASERPFQWEGTTISLEANAGIAITSSSEHDALVLMHHAALAIRSATSGGPGYSFFNPVDAEAAKRHNELMAIIAQAVEQRAFHLAYQPFFSFSNGKLAGFEALMRLRHPQYGNISPGEFIPIAEEMGLIKRLGAWCIEEACRTAAQWPHHLTVAVNCSPAQFYSGTLIGDVNQALSKSNFPAYRLEIEITEGTILKDEDLVLSQLNTLNDMGCSIALDDFGTGYSSLSYLWKFPFSKLKIDRSFIQVLDTTPKAPSILKSIMDLSRNLNLEVTAEGIETREQMETLRSLDCDYLQGYLCGRPTERTDLAAIILKNYSDILLRPDNSGDELASPNRRKIRVIR
jgi:EAL domain-containing protein (putative c-di-GMP-specific phosphodiesterase class I)/GGDEF domain-containing protein